MTAADVWRVIADNKGLIALLGLAFVVTMPEEPAPPFDKIPFIVWWWHWFHEGMRTFVNFRTPANTQATTYRQESPTMTTTQTTETKTAPPAPPKDASTPEK